MRSPRQERPDHAQEAGKERPGQRILLCLPLQLFLPPFLATHPDAECSRVCLPQRPTGASADTRLSSPAERRAPGLWTRTRSPRGPTAQQTEILARAPWPCERSERSSESWRQRQAREGAGEPRTPGPQQGVTRRSRTSPGEVLGARPAVASVRKAGDFSGVSGNGRGQERGAEGSPAGVQGRGRLAWGWDSSVPPEKPPWASRSAFSVFLLAAGPAGVCPPRSPTGERSLPRGHRDSSSSWCGLARDTMRSFRTLTGSFRSAVPRQPFCTLLYLTLWEASNPVMEMETLTLKLCSSLASLAVKMITSNIKKYL
ncbi:uncharacterized protein LOC117285311 [Fukomys damarensis]|uniref:uncharacterized protein LOC117285311 n=1 Tax=Fukomys damarensis TaxID=885580 RepID=UPI00145522DE|nr:uncharacterized protein LOC117285311 [Fukomys damarensis]